MPVALAHAVLAVVGGYLGLGIVVGVAFALFGVARVDAGAKGASWGFRLLILPGVIALWPWIARRWSRG